MHAVLCGVSFIPRKVFFLFKYDFYTLNTTRRARSESLFKTLVITRVRVVIVYRCIVEYVYDNRTVTVSFTVRPPFTTRLFSFVRYFHHVISTFPEWFCIIRGKKKINFYFRVAMRFVINRLVLSPHPPSQQK